MNIMAQIANAARELAPLLKTADFNAVVNTMSNHQRNQWARAGYPGLRKKDPAGPAKFIPTTKLLHRLQKSDSKTAGPGR